MSNDNFLPLRREEPALLRGEGRFTADVQAPQALHAVFVRSPLAYGRIRQIDTRAAHTAEGVVAVLTAQTLTDGGRAVDMPAPNPLLPIAQLPPMEPLARDRVQRPSCSAVGLSKRRAMQTLSDLTTSMVAWSMRVQSSNVFVG